MGVSQCPAKLSERRMQNEEQVEIMGAEIQMLRFLLEKGAPRTIGFVDISFYSDFCNSQGLTPTLQVECSACNFAKASNAVILNVVSISHLCTCAEALIHTSIPIGIQRRALPGPKSY